MPHKATDEQFDTPDEEVIDMDDVSGDVEYDETDGKLTAKLQKVKDDLKACQAERQEYLDGWQRAKADFVNLKKRSAEELLASRQRTVAGVIEELLPVLDSFEMAFKDQEAWESAPEQWRKGIEYIHTQLVGMLDNHGVVAIDPIGQPFNHDEHHSAETVAVDDASQDGTVVAVIRKGYKIGDTVIRPAHVKVGTTG